MSDYKVMPGDTLSEIAAAHNMPVGALTEHNKLDNPDKLQPGQSISIPDLHEGTANVIYNPDVPPAWLQGVGDYLNKARQPSEYADPPVATPVDASPNEDTKGDKLTTSWPQTLPDSGNSLAKAPPPGVEDHSDSDWYRFSVLPLAAKKEDGHIHWSAAIPGFIYNPIVNMHKIRTGEIPTYVQNPDTGEMELNPEVISTAHETAGLMMGGGAFGTGKAVTMIKPEDGGGLTADQIRWFSKQNKQLSRIAKEPNKTGRRTVDVDPSQYDFMDLQPMVKHEQTFTLGSGPVAPNKNGLKTTTNVSDIATNPWHPGEQTATVLDTAKLPNGDPLQIHYRLTAQDAGGYSANLNFGLGEYGDLHGDGDPHSNMKTGIDTMATVLDSVQNFVQKAKPEYLTFSAANSRLGKLYDKMAPLLSKKLGGDLSQQGINYKIHFPENRTAPKSGKPTQDPLDADF